MTCPVSAWFYWGLGPNWFPLRQGVNCLDFVICRFDAEPQQSECQCNRCGWTDWLWQFARKGSLPAHVVDLEDYAGSSWLMGDRGTTVEDKKAICKKGCSRVRGFSWRLRIPPTKEKEHRACYTLGCFPTCIEVREEKADDYNINEKKYTDNLKPSLPHTLAPT